MLIPQHHKLNQAAKCRKPAGFSLIEILVVLMILGILTALIVTAVGPLIGNAKIEATRVTIEQISEVINARVEAVNQIDLKQDAKRFASRTSSLDASNPSDVKAAEFILRASLMKQAIPQRPEDMYGLNGTDDNGGVDDAPYNATWSSPARQSSPDLDSGDDPDRTLSSEVLFHALTQGSAVRTSVDGKSFPVPILEIDNININHIADTDSDGISEFLDDWGNPLQFYSAPTRLVRPSGGTSNITDDDYREMQILISGVPSNSGSNSNPSHPLNQDPLDKTGLSYDEFSSSINVTIDGNSVSVEPFGEEAYYTPNTFYVPLLISAGRDQTLGMDSPALIATGSGTASERLGNVTDSASITDNITNRQQ